MPDDLDLHRPHGVDAQAWAAITSHRDRLADAMRGSDRSLVLGRAKELAESVARVVISERGQVAPASTDYPALIDSAHAVLKRQPGTDLSEDTDLRNLVQGAMKMVKTVGTLRNSLGSGHGRAREPIIEQEIVDLIIPATMLWVRWALARLAPLILGQPTNLINDLLSGAHFYKGILAERLLAANIVDLDEPIQERLGTAVAIRAMRNTVLVQVEGVEACANSDSLEQWPLHYRRGLVDGLFFDENGKARTAAWAVTLVPPILQPTDNPAGEVERMLFLLGNERLRHGDSDDDYTLWRTAESLTAKFVAEARPSWRKIAALFAPEPPF